MQLHEPTQDFAGQIDARHQHLPNARYEVLESLHGHDGFLIETEDLGALIAGFRARLYANRNLKAISAGSE